MVGVLDLIFISHPGGNAFPTHFTMVFIYLFICRYKELYSNFLKYIFFDVCEWLIVGYRYGMMWSWCLWRGWRFRSSEEQPTSMKGSWVTKSESMQSGPAPEIRPAIMARLLRTSLSDSLLLIRSVNSLTPSPEIELLLLLYLMGILYAGRAWGLLTDYCVE